MFRYILYTCILLFLPALAVTGSAQENAAFHPTHSIGINIGHEHSFDGVDENGKRQVAVLPYWGLDYNFRFAERFEAGLHVDLITESFKVERELDGGDKEIIERSYPVAPAAMLLYRLTEHWRVGAGMGGEFAKEGNYLLGRLAIEYGAEIRDGWEVFGVFQYDLRWKAYDTWTIGLGVSKAFGFEKATAKK